MARSSTLRGRLTVVTMVGAAIALAVSAALIVLTSQARQRTGELVAAMQKVRIVEQAELHLLLAGRAADPIVRARMIRGIRVSLARARDHVTTETGGAALADATAAVEAYVSAVERGAPTNGLEEVAHAALVRLGAINEAQAREAARRIRRADALGNAIGVAAVVLLCGSVLVVVWWLRTRAFAPMMRFLGAVAHDLRNPVNTMRMAVDLLGPAHPLPPEPRLRKTIAMFDRQLASLDRMVGDLLDLARIESGRLELRREPVALAPVVERAIEPFATVSPRHRIQVEAAADPRVTADPGRIEQVVGNLVSNAIKYTPAGGDVHVRVDRDDARGDAVIAVTDPGIGMSEEEQRRLFVPFERLGRSDAAGTGLGLYLTRRIVEAHGGSIQVRSRPGEGSTFEVRLAVA